MTVHIFDLDGTLLNLNLAIDDLEKLRNEMFHLIRERAADPGTKSIFGMYRKALTYENAHSPLIKKLRKLIDDVECKSIENVSINKTLISFALQKKQNGDRTCIVTNNGRRLIDLLISRGMLLNEAFDKIITRDDVRDIKPSAEPINAIIKSFHVSQHDDVFFIGDSVTDQESVNNFNSLCRPEIVFLHVKHLNPAAEKDH